MQCTQPAYMLAIPQQFRRLTGMQRRVLARNKINLDAKQAEQAFQFPFYIKEIRGSATVYPVFRILVTNHHPCQHRLLTDAIGTLNESQPGLEQANTGLLPVLVV